MLALLVLNPFCRVVSREDTSTSSSLPNFTVSISGGTMREGMIKDINNPAHSLEINLGWETAGADHWMKISVWGMGYEL